VLLAAAAPASAAPPTNDNFEQATTLSSTATGTLAEATREAAEPAHGFQTVWYAFRPDHDGRYALTVPRTSSSTKVTVYRGDSLSTLDRLGAAGPDAELRVPFDAVAGTTYRIAVGSPYEAQSAEFTLRIAEAPLPANDDFAAAQRVRVPGRYTGSLADATDELGEPDHGGQKPRQSVWYRFRAPRTGRLSIQASSRACGSASVAVYTGTRLESLREVGSTSGRTFRFRARRGRVYRVAVDCPYATTGDFELTLSDGSIEGKGVTIAPVAGQTVASMVARGLRTVVKAKRKVTVSIELVLDRRVALVAGIGNPVIGRVRGKLGYRQALPATIRLTPEARAGLSTWKSLSAVLRVKLLNTGAPNRVLEVPIELPN
jgi:hypothetical protein